MNASASCSYPQTMVDQTPKFDNQVRKRRRKRHRSQVITKGGMIRPDRRFKAKYV